MELMQYDLLGNYLKKCLTQSLNCRREICLTLNLPCKYSLISARCKLKIYGGSAYLGCIASRRRKIKPTVADHNDPPLLANRRITRHWSCSFRSGCRAYPARMPRPSDCRCRWHGWCIPTIGHPPAWPRPVPAACRPPPEYGR